MFKPVLVLFLLAGVLLAAQFSYADEAEQPMIIKTVSGKVNKTDWVGSTMIVRWFQPNGSYDEISIKVTKKTKIYKGGKPLSFAAINIWDDVSVKYYDDPSDFGPLRAVAVNVVSS